MDSQGKLLKCFHEIRSFSIIKGVLSRAMSILIAVMFLSCVNMGNIFYDCTCDNQSN